jgi:hypothetical protein
MFILSFPDSSHGVHSPSCLVLSPTFLNPQRKYGQGDYLLLYNTSSKCDWSCALNENSVDSSVYNFTASVSEATNEAILSVKPKSSTVPHWFSKSLIYYIKKLNQFLCKKSKYDFSIFSYYRKQVKTTII